MEELVGGWLSVPEFADALGITQRTARKMVNEGDVLSARIGPNNAVGIPAVFVRDGELMASIPGTVTVLRDGGLRDEAALEWLFTKDPSLPIDGCPMDMLLLGRKAEVRKRASELAF